MGRICPHTGCRHATPRGAVVVVSAVFAVMASRLAAEDGVEWIWGVTSPKTMERASEVQLEKELSIEKGSIKSAQLRIAADFAEGAVLLNGVEVANVGRQDPEVRHRDVTRRLQDGKNVLSVHAVRTGGPAAVAVELVIASTDGKRQTVRSDVTWRSAKPGQSVAAFGRANFEPWWTITHRPAIGSFDEYNQAVRRDGVVGDDASRFRVPDGFKLELVHAGSETDGSWVSLEIDPRGRYVIGKEKKGILRLTPGAGEGAAPRIEVINDTLQACHGLLFAHHSLYVVANGSGGLYRLRDTNGDDRFDEVRQLRAIPGGGGDHGRHALALGAGGEIHVINGDAVTVPDDFRSRVPSTREFGTTGKPRAGYLARTDADGTFWEIVASGLRNPFGVAINNDGELFTYDADSEAHTGLPWYRPTRILHLVQGADYGWRKNDREIWPATRPESLPAIDKIGKGSPTGVLFGTRSSFPPAYQKALFAFDWTYGRILAIHLVPRGASYVGHAEVFLRGRPMNVVDLDFDADGSMLFVTGGQVKRSSLYRLSFTGPAVQPPAASAQEVARREFSREMRSLRRSLEKLHQAGAPGAVETAWKHLAHRDPWIRHAARVALEHQPVASWRERALGETEPPRALPALLALVRVGAPEVDEAIRDRLYKIPLANLPAHLQSTAVRIAALLNNHDPAPLLAQFDPLFPSGRHSLDRDLCDLLAGHGSESVAGKTLAILASEPRQEDAFHYLLALSQTGAGWTPELRRSFFRLLRGAQLYMGDQGLPAVVQAMEKAALENAPEVERPALEKILARQSALESIENLPPRAFVKDWTLQDLAPSPADRQYKPDPDRGKALFRGALCAHCHRFGSEGRPFGPDLTAVSARFGREDLLAAILTPSATIATNHRSHLITLRDGKTVTGKVVWNGFRNSTLHLAPNPMQLDEVVKIAKREIVSHQESPVSPMPPGLLNTLTRHEILDLLAFLGISP